LEDILILILELALWCRSDPVLGPNQENTRAPRRSRRFREQAPRIEELLEDLVERREDDLELSPVGARPGAEPLLSGVRGKGRCEHQGPATLCFGRGSLCRRNRPRRELRESSTRPLFDLAEHVDELSSESVDLEPRDDGL